MKENTAAALYSSLMVDRQTALDIARECSKLTIPSLLPPEGSNNSTVLPQPYQSLGAYGLNNLAAKLLMALYPPGNAFFRYVMPEPVAAEAEQIDPEQKAQLQKTLASIENRVIQRFETSPIRPQKAEALMHLIVAGNVLTRFESLDEFRMYRLDQYVVRRSAAGKPMDVVIKETVPVRDLDEETITACGIKPDAKAAEVFTWVTWEDKRCRWHQEINDTKVPESEGDTPEDVAPWNPLRWKAVPTSDYGRGHCEEYLGDLQSLEGLSQSNVEYAAIAAKVILLVAPGSQTNVEDVNKARSGDAVAGREEDIHAFTLDKYADFKVVEVAISRLEERLSRAFLIRSGMIRDAERVTAEEVRDIAQELEDTLGGVYTVLAQEEQMPFIRRLLAVEERAGDIPRLPKDAVSPVVVTGFQALGRNHSLNKLRGAIQDLVGIFGNEGVIQILQPTDIATRILLGWGVEDASSVVKSAAQIAQERAEQMKAQVANTLMEKGTAPAVAGVMKNANPNK